MSGGLPTDLAGAIALAGVDPLLPERALQDAIRSAIADRRGYLGDWYVGELNWTVELLSPERQDVHGTTLEETLAWCLVDRMTADPGIGGFASERRLTPRAASARSVAGC